MRATPPSDGIDDELAPSLDGSGPGGHGMSRRRQITAVGAAAGYAANVAGRIAPDHRAPRRGGVITALIVSFLAGCSSGPVRIGPVSPSAYETVGPTKGGACGVLLFSVIPIRVNDRVQRAYDEALAGKGTGLIDTELQHSWWYIPYVGPMYCTHISGTVIRARP